MRVDSGSSSRSRPSTCSTSKNHGCSSVSRAASAPNRDIVSWNGRGAPSSSSESVSPSRITSRTGIRRTTSTTSGRRWVMSARLRVNTRTSSPARCTWMRAPSSLYSTDASPVVASASAALGAVAASIGSTGRPTTSPTSSSSAAVPVSASRAVSPRSPESIAARRTTSPGRSAARAMASVSTPSSAPVRISPSSARLMKPCSRSVARAVSSRSAPARSPADPEPEVVASRSSSSSRSATVSVGSAAGSPIAADIPRQPTPTRPCRGLPTRNPTAGAISSGSRRRSSSASASTFASRDRVEATASAVVTSSSSSTGPVCHRPPTAAARR